jgi:integrase/recombinase XerD
MLRLRPRRPHIYTRNEVHRIMAASQCIGPTEGLRPLVFSNLIGLLYSTGLRIGEALKLTIGDVDLKRRLIHIREGKFKKSRYVPLSKSTADHLAAYLQRRQRAGFPTSSTSPVFVTPAGGRYGKSTIATIFLAIVRTIGIRGPKGQRGPRIDDFRQNAEARKMPNRNLKSICDGLHGAHIIDR